MDRKASRKRFRRVLGGLALTTLVSVLSIAITLLAAANYRRIQRAAVRQAAESEIRQLESQLQRFQAESGAYPTTEQGLQILPKSDSNARPKTLKAIAIRG